MPRADDFVFAKQYAGQVIHEKLQPPVTTFGMGVPTIKIAADFAFIFWSCGSSKFADIQIVVRSTPFQ